ncbi:flagellar biosynthetic protein FliR [Desulfoplanes formicivorans]|uniref:Flagellar biosynthetic protein FliR n=1 Tax=Desulfoplanes formicivorans TaxID=1592317 RepID=A0A194AJZ4_9BACT|nr:flagellar biosynthetic protein FliR [Desulfoplanes formicivorans]GAU09044.1 flagellar biosynthesis protein FliR [Desulfoplanes formicivorans]
MDLFHFDPLAILSFLLTLFRISLLVFLLPFFGGDGVPTLVKGALCLLLSFALWPTLSFSGITFPAHPFSIALMIGSEILLGLTIGLVIRFLFAAIQTGGMLIGFQMGFSMVNVVDPDSGVSESVTAHFLYMIALMTFLSINGHLYLLKALALSFKFIPPGGMVITPQMYKGILSFSGQIFVLAIKIASPVMIAIFLVDLALALISRAAPQMNVLIVGFPIKIAVGFLFLGVLFTIVSMLLNDFVATIGPAYHRLLAP